MEGVDQAVDGGHAVLLGNLGQMRIARGGDRACVPEQLLNVAQAQASFEQMGGKAVAEGVHGNFFLMPQALTMAFTALCVLPRFM